MGVTEKAFKEGSTFPEHEDPKLLRLYSMRFCPYAQRTRLALRYLSIPHEEVNVNLKSKPDWFVARNPLGLVPVLELGDKIVYESAICNDYLNETHGSRLLPTDAYERARVRILMDGFSRVTDKFYGIMLRLKTEEEKEAAVEELNKNLQKYEDTIKTKFFGGEGPGLLDFHIWPWFERFPVAEKFAGITIFSPEKFPKLATWINNMKSLPAVQQVSHPVDRHIEFIQHYLNGSMPDYDLGL